MAEITIMEALQTTTEKMKEYPDDAISEAKFSGSELSLDTTLSIAGRAADAKAVGNAIRNIPTVEITTELTEHGKAADAKAVGDALANISKAETQPVVTYWKYNGSVFTKFEYDTNKYPNVCIIKKDAIYMALCCAEIWNVENGVVVCTAKPYYLVDGVWIAHDIIEFSESISNIELVWTNTEIVDVDGTVYAEISEDPTPLLTAKNVYILDSTTASTIVDFSFLTEGDVILLAVDSAI